MEAQVKGCGQVNSGESDWKKKRRSDKNKTSTNVEHRYFSSGERPSNQARCPRLTAGPPQETWAKRTNCQERKAVAEARRFLRRGLCVECLLSASSRGYTQSPLCVYKGGNGRNGGVGCCLKIGVQMSIAAPTQSIGQGGRQHPHPRCRNARGRLIECAGSTTWGCKPLRGHERRAWGVDSPLCKVPDSQAVRNGQKHSREHSQNRKSRDFRVTSLGVASSLPHSLSRPNTTVGTLTVRKKKGRSVSTTSRREHLCDISAPPMAGIRPVPSMRSWSGTLARNAMP